MYDCVEFDDYPGNIGLFKRVPERSALGCRVGSNCEAAIQFCKLLVSVQSVLGLILTSAPRVVARERQLGPQPPASRLGSNPRGNVGR